MAGALATPASALAHAVLIHTTPHQGTSVDRAPSAVQLDFNEPIEVSSARYACSAPTGAGSTVAVSRGRAPSRAA